MGLARFLPFGAFLRLGQLALGFYYAVAGRKLRKVARESLTVAFGNSLSDAEKNRITQSSFQNLMNGLIGKVFSSRHPGFAGKVFTLEGQTALDSALRENKGAVIAVAHFGPFSWMMFKFIDLGYRVSVVMRPPRNSFVYSRLKDSRQICKLQILYSSPVRNCVVDSVKALEQGEIVFMPVDQNYGGQGRVFVDFFGRKAATAPGPVMFALKTGSPLFFAYALPEGRGRFRITLDPVPLVSGTSERETLVLNTATLTKKIEGLARQYPEQWSWMHKRWKTVPREGEI